MKRQTYESELNALLQQFANVPKEHFLFPSGYDEVQMLEQINSCFDIVTEIKSAEIDDSDRCSLQSLESMYLREVWDSGNDSGGLSTGETEEVTLGMIENAQKPQFVDQRTWTKVGNIVDAMRYLRVTSLCGASSEPPARLTVDVIKNVHYSIGKTLIADAGNFRTIEAGAAQTSVIFLPSARIEKRLATLVNFIANGLDAVATESDRVKRLKGALSLAALFLSEFLYIHPFANGNGRCARLLVSFLLSRFCVVPLSLSLQRGALLDLLVFSRQRRGHGGLVV